MPLRETIPVYSEGQTKHLYTWCKVNAGFLNTIPSWKYSNDRNLRGYSGSKFSEAKKFPPFSRWSCLGYWTKKCVSDIQIMYCTKQSKRQATKILKKKNNNVLVYKFTAYFFLNINCVCVSAVCPWKVSWQWKMSGRKKYELFQSLYVLTEYVTGYITDVFTQIVFKERSYKKAGFIDY